MIRSNPPRPPAQLSTLRHQSRAVANIYEAIINCLKYDRPALSWNSQYRGFCLHDRDFHGGPYTRGLTVCFAPGYPNGFYQEASNTIVVGLAHSDRAVNSSLFIAKAIEETPQIQTNLLHELSHVVDIVRHSTNEKKKDYVDPYQHLEAYYNQNVEIQAYLNSYLAGVLRGREVLLRNMEIAKEKAGHLIDPNIDLDTLNEAEGNLLFDYWLAKWAWQDYKKTWKQFFDGYFVRSVTYEDFWKNLTEENKRRVTARLYKFWQEVYRDPD